MRHRRSLALALVTVALVLSACGEGDEPAEDATQPLAEAGDEGVVATAMTGADGAEVGTVTLTPRDGATRIDAEVEGIEPGFHGFHIHDVGLCEADAPDGPFTTATGHYVGAGGSHGDHDGDMPSLYVKEDGSARLTVEIDTFTLDELTEGDGAAVMIHAGADNFANIPDRYTSSASGEPGPDEMTNSTGDAGARAACGVIEATPGA